MLCQAQHIWLLANWGVKHAAYVCTGVHCSVSPTACRTPAVACCNTPIDATGLADLPACRMHQNAPQSA